MRSEIATSNAVFKNQGLESSEPRCEQGQRRGRRSGFGILYGSAGFDERELRRIRQFYLTFPIRDTLRPELSRSHYRLLLRGEDERRGNFTTRPTP
ncbi:MAG: hypothetical protein IPO07_28120 [Haliscomenobacter sp.]|nr:hypothetical protein [Haliscomenobacter sp.]